MAQSEDGGDQLDQQDVAALKQMAEWWREQDESGQDDASVGRTTRRKFMGLLAGAGLGAASVGGYATGQAQAGTESAGVIGTEANPADAYVEDLYDHNGNQVLSLPGDGSVSIDKLLHTQYIVQNTASGTEIYEPDDYANAGAAVQAALNDPAGDVEVVMPFGPIPVSDTITVPTGSDRSVRLRGRNSHYQSDFTDTGDTGGTRLVSNITDGSAVLDIPGSDGDEATGTWLGDFMIEGNGSEGIGLRASYLTMSGRMEGITVYGVGGRGFQISDSWGMEFSSLSAVDCGGIGIYSRNNNGSVFHQPNAHDCNGVGIDEDYSLGLTISGPYVERCADGLQLKPNTRAATITGASMEGNGTHDAIDRGYSNVFNGFFSHDTPYAMEVFGTGGTYTGIAANDSDVYDGREAVISVNGPERATVGHINNATDGDIAHMNYTNALSIDFLSEPEVNGEVGVSPTGTTYTAYFDFWFDNATKPMVDVYIENDTPVSYSLTNWGEQYDRYNSVDIVMSESPNQLSWKAHWS